MKRISVDFDGTLRRFNNRGQNIFQKILMRYLIKEQKKGSLIMLNTLRTNPERITEALNWIHEKGLYPAYVNENDPNAPTDGAKDSRKIDADIYIDDRNIGLIGWLLRSF